MKTICLVLFCKIRLDNSGELRFLPRSSSKIVKSLSFSCDNNRSDSSWRALSPSKLECGRIIISAANGVLRRSKKRKTPGWIQGSFFLPIERMVIFILDNCGGERGIRTLDELPHTAFRERPVQPLLHLSIKLMWYTRQDSNLRPLAPQASALSSWATGAYSLSETRLAITKI